MLFTTKKNYLCKVNCTFFSPKGRENNQSKTKIKP